MAATLSMDVVEFETGLDATLSALIISAAYAKISHVAAK